MMLQLIADTSISANWTIAAILGVTAVLLMRILNRIENKLENHETRIQASETDIAVLKSKDENS
jgi:hypothetical protein